MGERSLQLTVKEQLAPSTTHGAMSLAASTRCRKRVYGHLEQGARFGHTKIQGKSLLVRELNALTAVVSMPLSGPVIAATWRRGGSAASARGAASLAAQTVGTARDRGCTGMIITRMDSAYYNASVIGAIRGQGARFSVTVPMNSSIRAAIAAIPEESWTAIKYPEAVWDDQLGCWTSDAEVAEAGYAAFASKKLAVTARLVVRRVRDKTNKAAEEMDELFPAWRQHAVFTDSPFELVQAEGQHRSHAIVEQVFADVTSGPLAHLPSGHFAANAAWLSIAAMAQPAARGRRPGQPALRESTGRHDPPRAGVVGSGGRDRRRGRGDREERAAQGREAAAQGRRLPGHGAGAGRRRGLGGGRGPAGGNVRGLGRLGGVLGRRADVARVPHRLGPEPMRELFGQVARPVADMVTAGAFLGRRRLMSVDGMEWDVPDTPANAASFGYPGTGKDDHPGVSQG